MRQLPTQWQKEPESPPSLPIVQLNVSLVKRLGLRISTSLLPLSFTKHSNCPLVDRSAIRIVMSGVLTSGGYWCEAAHLTLQIVEQFTVCAMALVGHKLNVWR